MFKTRIKIYLLISLILFQSFYAVANTLNFHAIDPQHLSKVHEHQPGDNVAVDKQKSHLTDSFFNASSDNSPINHISTDTSHNPADCHHCGHCHGTHAQWIGNSTSIELALVATHHGFYYLSQVVDAPVTPLLRPPKV